MKSILTISLAVLTIFAMWISGFAQDGFHKKQLPKVFISNSVKELNTNSGRIDSTLLWDNFLTPTDVTVISSQYGGLSNPDSNTVQSADDFVIPTGEIWNIDKVIAPGEYSPIAPTADFFKVEFYTDASGIPGTFIESRIVNSVNDTLMESFSSPVTLSAGTYWVSVIGSNNTASSINDYGWWWELADDPQVGNIPYVRNLVQFLGSPFDWTSITDLGVQFSNFMFQIYGDSFVPVELTSFIAIVNERNVDLSWATATETNNQGFDIERNSGNGFEKVGYVSGFGTTTEPRFYTFEDNNLTTGIYSYRLKQIDYDGTYEYSDEIEVEMELPLDFALEQNYPNPFNPNTVIKYSIPVDGFVSLAVYNAIGEKVAELVNGQVKAGVYEVNFNATGLTSGIYFYRIVADNYVDVKKMILLR